MIVLKKRFLLSIHKKYKFRDVGIIRIVIKKSNFHDVDTLL